MSTRPGWPTVDSDDAVVAETTMLGSLIDHHAIAALMIDVKTLRVLWSSNASVALDGRLVVGTCLRELPELFAVLQEPLKIKSPETQTPGIQSAGQIVARCTLFSDTSAAAKTDSGNVEISDKAAHYQDAKSDTQVENKQDGPVKTGTDIRIRSVSKQASKHLFLLEPEQALDNYYRQYIADREKLFNTSRALTVNEMATTLAHELNQPIGTVVNLLNGCLDRLRSHNESDTHGPVDSDVVDALDFAIRQSRFASQIIARVREFTEARQPNMELLDIRVLVQDSVQLLDWVFASEHISLSLGTSATPLVVACDRMLLQQVLVNLCRNAIEAMREMSDGERRLDIRTHHSDDGIQVDIADSGPGMANDTMNNMFTPFVSSKRDGMGVGLNICRSFVELHQGRLWVTQNEFGGCTIHIQLPAAQLGRQGDA